MKSFCSDKKQNEPNKTRLKTFQSTSGASGNQTHQIDRQTRVRRKFPDTYFFLLNVDLGKDYQVKAEINDETYLIDKWQPYYIEGLPMGENTISLTLIDANGEAVDTPLNPVTRTFTLQADPIEEVQ